jgi:hypothetical protein
MSWQAQTAVTHHSKQRNVARLRLLMYLAEGADASGLIDPAPNQETLADFISCSTRSIRTMLSDLVADGELEQTRIGSGPGNPSAYRILLPMAEKELTHGVDKGGRKAEENPDFLSTFEAFKAEVKAEIFELKAEIFELKAEKVEAKGGKGGSERRKRLSTESADDPYYDPSFDPISIQEGTPQPPYPPELTDDGFTPEDLMWQTAVTLVNRWASYRGTYRRLDPGKQDDANDYFRPILGLVVECGGDGEQAWRLMKSQCERMVADGLTVVRAGPVVSQIRNEQERAELPAAVPRNGRSSAETVAAQYAQMRQEFFSDG